MKKTFFLLGTLTANLIFAEAKIESDGSILKRVNQAPTGMTLIGSKEEQVSKVVETASGQKMYAIPYTIKKGDTFSSILKDFVKLDSIINAKTPMIHMIRQKNPQIKSWEKLQEGVKIDLYVQESFLNEKAYQEYKDQELKKIQQKVLTERELQRQKMKKNAMPKGLKLSAFYMASTGTFDQKANDKSVEVNTTQDSPYSVGIAALYYPANKLYSFSTSAYYSALRGAVSSLGTDVDTPAEIGINFYTEYRLIGSFPITLYGGVDLEKFSTLNIDALYQESQVIIDESTVGYLTLGVAKLLSIGSVKLFNKLSFSKSFFSSTEKNYGGAQTDDFSGLKFMYYLNYKVASRWFIHGLAKWHVMSGPNDMAVTRFGLGFGYIFR